MHDIRSIRANPAAFAAALARRGVAGVDALLAADARARAAQTSLQTDLARRNELSRAVGAAKAARDEARAAALMAEVAALKEAVPTGEAAERAALAEVEALAAALPNLPCADVPDGLDETANVELHRWGTPHAFDFAPAEHDALAVRLGYDPEAAARIAGARFAVLSGGLARLHRALGQWMLDTQVAEQGYLEVAPPLIVRRDAVYGVGQLPKFEDDLFQTTDGRWLISTAEVSLTNLAREQILDAETLPRRYTALTPCFRSEAGAAGRDTRGLIRQHQFEKVELVSIVHPDAAAAEHERITRAAEIILERLELPYRRMLLCAGDMGFAARRTYDLEVWLPGQNQYREISSCSDCGDFQARRMDARFRTRSEKGTRFVHTLNGSGLAVGRTLVAVLENHQQADGAIAIPEPLRPYMAGLERLEPAA